MAEPTEGEFDLNSLGDQELAEQVHDDLYNGLKIEVEEATRIFLKRGWSAERVLNDALVEGMRIVGIDFRDGILFVPEVLLAANAMKGGMEILRPLLAETGVEPIGKIVIGTVKGDIHDIGKNLVSRTSKPAPSCIIDTRFVPMSWMSPLTVPMTILPIGSTPVSASSGRRNNP